MKPVKRILVPTDFSRGSEYARAFAHRMAVRFGARVDLIHVIPSTFELMIPVDKKLLAELGEKLRQEAAQKLEISLMNYDEENRGDLWVVEDRKASEAILKHVKENPGRYDLIIMGAKGTDKSKMRRGGTTIRTIRTSPVPVLSVDSNLLKRGVRNLILPVDSSPLSFGSLPMALTIAKGFGSEITLLYVMEIYAGVMGGSGLHPEDVQQEKIYERMMEKLEHHLKTRFSGKLQLIRGEKRYNDTLVYVDGETKQTFTLNTVIKIGHSAHHEIESYTSKHGDMVVMVTHGHSGFAHLFLGSVAEKVVNYVKKPVLTIKPTPAEFAKAQKDDGGLITRASLP
ncbi:MAG: universal stress protein [Balneolaceae bacterium]|nr:universal stress protein [Balneolaceae bacterium]MCH8550263.1 universal stress protein [Balneolaceae bacterium]